MDTMVDYLIDMTLAHGDPVENGMWFSGLWGEIFLILHTEYGAFDDE